MRVRRASLIVAVVVLLSAALVVRTSRRPRPGPQSQPQAQRPALPQWELVRVDDPVIPLVSPGRRVRRVYRLAAPEATFAANGVNPESYLPRLPDPPPGRRGVSELINAGFRDRETGQFVKFGETEDVEDLGPASGRCCGGSGENKRTDR